MTDLLGPTTPKAYLGVDTGGTFTDFYYWSAQGSAVHKVLSTPKAPEQAILQGIQDMGIYQTVAAGEVVVVHGSTVATNAALEKKGVKTVYVANEGFADLLSLGRQNRPDIYALNPQAQEPPVPRDLCIEVPCRADHNGHILKTLDEEHLQTLREEVERLRPEAVAINLLYSYLRDDEEKRIQQALSAEWFVCRSSEVLPEYKEYERGMATWLNAWLGPKVEGYLRRLSGAFPAASLAIMQSSGGTIAAAQAARRAVNLLLSGPAGGLAAARFIGKQVGQSKLLTFDMGGTSTDVALIDGDIRLTSEGKLGDYPVAVPMVDMHTIGAGGGSVAYLDSGGMLHVGPESAGASPGPACYGQGGAQPTVTDANVVLGRLRPDGFLGGRMHLDTAAAISAVDALAREMELEVDQLALGIIALANEHMANALRVISVQKGFDPAEFELCCFGGAGGLHVCALAEELGVSRVLVPANGGVLSALGMLVAPRQRNLSKSLIWSLQEGVLEKLKPIIDDLVEDGVEALREEGVSEGLTHKISLDCRYQGQSFCLSVPFVLSQSISSQAVSSQSVDALLVAFHALHRKTYGHQLPLPVELVNIRVQVEAAANAMLDSEPQATALERSPLSCSSIILRDLGDTRVMWRSDLTVGEDYPGPTIVCETVATTLILPGWIGCVDGAGHLRLRRA